MRALRSLVAFVVPALTGILLLVLLLPLGRRRSANLTIPVVAFLGTRLAGIRFRVHGDTSLLKQRPAVFVINHQSGTDPIIVAALLRQDICAVAKRRLRRHLLLGPLLGLAGTVFVDSSRKPGSRALAPALPRLKQGYAVVIAPEGHRSDDRTLQAFRPGALWLASEARVPLIPVVLHNSRDILPARALLMRPGEVRVTVLAPLDPASLSLEKLEERFRETLAHDPAARERSSAGVGDG